MLTVGAQFAHYRIEALLGEGGMGQVYRAFDEKLHRRVALKVLTAADATAAPRMVREARAAAALEHPNKVSVFELGEVDGTPYLAMELITGPTLRTMVGDRSIVWQDAIAWLLDVGRALDAAHAAGLVHRDIKPDNVMLREDGVVKVLDFGIARRSAAVVDASAPTGAAGLPSATGGVIAGTAAYMAPEQVRGDDLDGRCDQFAWGVMAFELLTGEHPWGSGRDPLALISAMLTKKPALLSDRRPELPAALSDAISRTLSSERDDRYPTMRALVNELAPLIGQSERGTPAPAAKNVKVQELALARTEQAPTTTAPSSATGTEQAPPTGGRARNIIVIGAVCAGAGLLALLALRAPSPATAPGAGPSASTPAVHAPVFTCVDTQRPFAAGFDAGVCSEGAVAWCSQTGRLVACCAKGLVPEGEDGACGCPLAAAADPSSHRLPSCPPPTLPPLKSPDIQDVVRAHFSELRRCCEAGLRRSPKNNGKVAFWFEIDPAGNVFFARIQEDMLADPEAEKCMLEIVRGLHFPPPGDVMTVVYPIILNAGD